MKEIEFLGDSLRVISGFPKEARQNAGRQLAKVQKGNLPDSYKPMPEVGKGVEEIRIRDESGISSSVVHSTLGGCGLRFACVSEENGADFKARYGDRKAAL
jgi:phage-related protein